METCVVTYEGCVRETYLVEAESPEDARQKWPDGELIGSEVFDGEVVRVEVDHD